MSATGKGIGERKKEDTRNRMGRAFLRDFFYLYFEKYYDLANDKKMDKVLRTEAHSNSYHPICDYLNQLKWDGTERIRYVMKRYMGVGKSTFFRFLAIKDEWFSDD